MDFLIQWLWYFAALLLGSLAAWIVAAVTIGYVSEQEAIEAMPGAREPRDRS